MILSLDQSLSSTGYALARVGGDTLTSGEFPLCAGVACRDDGFLELWRRLDAWHKEHGLTAICHEEPISKKTDKTPTQIALYGLVAIVELFAISRGRIPVHSYESRQWRMSFFSKEERALAAGDRWKRLAIERCRQFDFDPAGNDEAEAIGILDHHMHKMKITPFWRAAHPFLPMLG